MPVASWRCQNMYSVEKMYLSQNLTAKEEYRFDLLLNMQVERPISLIA